MNVYAMTARRQGTRRLWLLMTEAETVEGAADNFLRQMPGDFEFSIENLGIPGTDELSWSEDNWCLRHLALAKPPRKLEWVTKLLEREQIVSVRI